MLKRSSYILLALTLVIGCAGSKEARTGSVAGAVFDDATGAPLRDAVVRLIRSDQDVEVPEGHRWNWHGAQVIPTGDDAKFMCEGLSPGFYLARPSYPGYRWNETRRIEVRPGNTTSVVFRMQRDPTGILERVR